MFFTRSIPGAARNLTIEYYGYGNSGVFGRTTTTLAGVGGANNVSTVVQLNAGAETVDLRIEYTASTRQIRASITEQVSGLATVRYVAVNLRYTESRTVPATPATVQDVVIGTVRQGETFVVAMNVDPVTRNVVLTTKDERLDTGYTFGALFGSTGAGTLAATGDDSVLFDYRGFDPDESLIQSSG